MAIYSYQRVSTFKQDNNRQEYVIEKELKERGISKIDKSFRDTISGKTKDRPALKELMDISKENDVIYCEAISRLSRSLKDAITIIDYFVEKKVRVVLLKENIDTKDDTYKLLLAIFASVAEMERENIQQRVQQKIDYLKEEKQKGNINTKSGRWFGREEVTKEYILEKYPKFEKYLQQVDMKIINKIEMSKLLGISRSTLYRYIYIYNNSK